MSNLKKAAAIAFMSFAVMVAAPKAEAGSVKMSIGTGYYATSDDPDLNGYTTNFGVDFALDDGMTAGFYREEINMEKSADSDAGSTTIPAHDVDVSINEIRVTKEMVPGLVAVGIGLGGADISISQNNSGLSNRYSTSVPVADIFANVTAFSTNGKKVRSSLDIGLGYRFADNSFLSADGTGAPVAGVPYVADLSGYYVRLSAGLGF